MSSSAALRDFPVAYVYVVAAAGPDPDRIRCPVPWRLNEALIFFGACKKTIRQSLRARYLGHGVEEAELSDEIWLVGLSPANGSAPRKVLFAGRVARIMTFGRAFESLAAPLYQAMREHSHSPLHLRPLRQGTVLTGYEHVSQLHAKGDAWVRDLVSGRGALNVRKVGSCLLARDGIPAWNALPRDATLLLENLFYTQGRAIALDKQAVDILRRAQHAAIRVSAHAPFGLRSDGRADGLRGRYLSLKGESVYRFVHWVQMRALELAQ